MRRFAIAVALLLVSSFAVAQNIGPLPPLTAHVDVNVVNVDVAVTDRSGKPVLDLTRDDFEIYEDGKLQKVTNFAIIQDLMPRSGPAAVAEAAAARPSDAVTRKIVLLVDNNFIEKMERNRALATIERYLDSTFNGEWAVASIGHSVDVIQPFTHDRAALRRAFQRVRETPTWFGNQQVDRSILSDQSRKYLEYGNDQSSGAYDLDGSIRFSSREQTYRSLMTVQNTARAVVETAHAYASDEGKKFIILLSGGIETNTTFNAYAKGRPDRELEQIKLDMAKVLDAMVQEANASNFTIHVVNARTRGMQAPQHSVENRSAGLAMDGAAFYRGDTGSEPIDTADVDSAPLSIALGTGGMYLPQADVSASMAKIEEVTSNFYSLGYSPEHQGDRRYHHIKVKVKRPSMRIANRVGYVDLSPDDRLEERLRNRLAMDHDSGTLPVRIKFGQARDAERQMVVPVQAAMPMDKITMLPRDGELVGRVHVYLSVFDDKGHNVGFHHQTQEVTVTPAQLAASGDGAFHYTMNVRVQKGGTFTVVVTLRDELSNEMGTASQPLTM
jgi:VWFA-related protein